MCGSKPNVISDMEPWSWIGMWPAREFLVTFESMWISVSWELSTGGNQKLKRVVKTSSYHEEIGLPLQLLQVTVKKKQQKNIFS